MPNPGSHQYDVERSRLRAEYDESGMPDSRADAAADEELERRHPPVKVGDPERAAGPLGGEGPGSGGVTLRSPAFVDHELMPDRYALDIGDTAPPLEWTDVPDDAAELALVCEDRDAPGGTFVHWVLVGIPASATGLEPGELPDGAVSGRNDYGELGWGGPHPPVGDEPHRYFFRLYALDGPLGLAEGVEAPELRAAADGRQLAVGTLVARFGR